MTHTIERKNSQGPSLIDARVRRAIATHFDPDSGTPYWLDRQAALSINARRDIRSFSDLQILGEMNPSDLSERSLRDHVPRRYHAELGGYIVGQTGGTTGGGAWTIYRPDEFEEAFITPFTVAAEFLGFPRGERWLFVDLALEPSEQLELVLAALAAWQPAHAETPASRRLAG